MTHRLSRRRKVPSPKSPNSSPSRTLLFTTPERVAITSRSSYYQLYPLIRCYNATRPRMNLSTFPSEIFASILGFDDSSYLVINLYICGNLELTRKLQHGLHEVHLLGICNRPDSSPKSLPRLLSTLQTLRTLTIRTEKRWTSLSDLSSMLQVFPASLETLNLTWGYGTVMPSTIEAYRTLPHLTSLRLSGSDSDGIRAHFQSLPSTLTHLGFTELGINERSLPAMAALPRSLLRLDAYIQVDWTSEIANGFQMVLDDWLQCPPHLEYISSLAIEGTPPPCSHWLPQSLLIDIFSSSSNTPLSDRVPFMPPKINNLDCYVVPEPSWENFLPHGLKHLSVFRFAAAKVEVHPSMLPKTLTSFSTQEAEAIVVLPDRSEKSDIWPPRLKSFAVDHHLDIERLPTTLHHLQCRLNCTETPSVSFGLLHCLTSLDLLTLNMGTIANFIDSFPPSLTKLALNSASNAPDNYASLATFQLISKATSLLELSTTVSDQAIRQHKEAWPLPPHLKTFNVNGWMGAWLSSLPSSLTKLKVLMLYTVSSESMTIFEGLPCSLRSIYLPAGTHQRKNAIYSPKSFCGLNVLKSLQVSEVFTFPSCILQYFPRNMSHLGIRLDKTQGTRDEDFAFMPPLLRGTSKIL